MHTLWENIQNNIFIAIKNDSILIQILEDFQSPKTYGNNYF